MEKSSTEMDAASEEGEPSAVQETGDQPPKRRRRAIPLATKESIIHDCELALQEKNSFRSVARKWELNPQTISHIWKHREKILRQIYTNSTSCPPTTLLIQAEPTTELLDESTPPLPTPKAKKRRVPKPSDNDGEDDGANKPTKKAKKSVSKAAKSDKLDKSASSVKKVKPLRLPPTPLSIVEESLATWLDEQAAKGITQLKTPLLERAKDLAEQFDEKLKPIQLATNFNGDDDSWLKSFCKRFGTSRLDNPLAQKEKPADHKTKFIAKFAKIVSEGEYKPEQIFSVDEMGLYWKLGKHHQRVTLLMGGNASGDCKLKPLLINSIETPRALLHVHRNTLPVTYRANKSLTMNLDILTKWFRKSFIPSVKEFLEKRSIQFKVLLVMDSAPPHKQLASSNKHVRVLYIPPLVSCKIQPMINANLREALRFYYFKRTMKAARDHISSNEKEGSLKQKMREFWRNYNIRQCIDNLSKAWNEDVCQALLLYSWKNLFPTNPTILDYELEEPPHVLTGELAEFFTPMLDVINEDLVDYDELYRYQITKLIREHSLAPKTEEKADSNLPSSSGPFASTSQWPCQPSTSSQLPFHTASTPPSSTSPTKMKRKRPLLQQALLNGSQSIKETNDYSLANSNGQPGGSKDQQQGYYAEINGLMGESEIAKADFDQYMRNLRFSMEEMVGPERYHLLLRVLTISEEKLYLGRQLLKLLDKKGTSDGVRLDITKSPENTSVIQLLRDALGVQMKFNGQREEGQQSAQLLSPELEQQHPSAKVQMQPSVSDVSIERKSSSIFITQKQCLRHAVPVQMQCPSHCNPMRPECLGNTLNETNSTNGVTVSAPITNGTQHTATEMQHHTPTTNGTGDGDTLSVSNRLHGSAPLTNRIQISLPLANETLHSAPSTSKAFPTLHKQGSQIDETHKILPASSGLQSNAPASITNGNSRCAPIVNGLINDTASTSNGTQGCESIPNGVHHSTLITTEETTVPTTNGTESSSERSIANGGSVTNSSPRRPSPLRKSQIRKSPNKSPPKTPAKTPPRASGKASPRTVGRPSIIPPPTRMHLRSPRTPKAPKGSK